MASPSSVGSTVAEATPNRFKWGSRLTTEMPEELAAAREELEIDSMAKLMTATGASHSNVWTWLRSPAAPVNLGQTNSLSENDEDVISYSFADEGDDILTGEYASFLLCSYLWGVGRVFATKISIGRGACPVATRSSVE